MNRITRTTFNGKFFYKMSKPELQYCMEIIMSDIRNYKPSISGVCIPEQEAQQERWNAWQTAEYHLNKLTKGENNECRTS